MINSIDAPFDKRPKTFDGIRMSRAVNIELCPVINTTCSKPILATLL